MCKRKLVEGVVLHNFPESQAFGCWWIYCVPHLSSSCFSLFYVPQLQGSSHKSDVNMKTQILILEEQKNEVSTSQTFCVSILQPAYARLKVHSLSVFTQLLSINEKWAKEYRTMVHYYKEKVRKEQVHIL